LFPFFLENKKTGSNLINSCVYFCSDQGVKACRCILILQELCNKEQDKKKCTFGENQKQNFFSGLFSFCDNEYL